MDIRLALMTGIDIPLQNCKIILHQPSVLEISYLGEEDFFEALKIITIDKTSFSKDKNALVGVTNFQIFMKIVGDKETPKEVKEKIKSFLSLIFPTQKALFTPKSILLQGENGTDIIDESNFPNFQQLLKKVFCVKEKTGEEDFNPANSKAQEIANKILQGRKKIAELKGTDNMSIFSNYLSILSVGLHISLLDLVHLTMYQIMDLLERYMLYINWDLDIRCRLAGGSPDSKAESWMQDIHKKNY